MTRSWLLRRWIGDSRAAEATHSGRGGRDGLRGSRCRREQRLGVPGRQAPLLRESVLSRTRGWNYNWGSGNPGLTAMGHRRVRNRAGGRSSSCRRSTRGVRGAGHGPTLLVVRVGRQDGRRGGCLRKSSSSWAGSAAVARTAMTWRVAGGRALWDVLVVFFADTAGCQDLQDSGEWWRCCCSHFQQGGKDCQ